MSQLDPAGFLREFRDTALARGFTVESLLETEAGPLLVFEGTGDGAPAYLSAGIHGDEPAGPLAALELLREGFFDGPRHWTLCPALNPVGLVAGTRENGAGIDLNRDYLQRASAEIAAHGRWLEARPHPELFVSLHEDWESSGFYFYEINLGDDRPDRAEAILGDVSRHLTIEPESRIDDHSVRSPGWIFHRAEADLPEHWPEAIFLAKSGCPLSFTLETPSAAAMEARIAAHCSAVRRIQKLA